MGQCRDANTREALEFVQIVLGEGVAHAATDSRGEFRLQAGIGSYSLKASFLGYEPYTLVRVITVFEFVFENWCLFIF